MPTTFDAVAETMPSNQTSYYEEVLVELFHEYLDFRYLVDDQTEKTVLAAIIYNLIAYQLAKLGPYAEGIWRERYKCEVLDLVNNPSIPARDYYSQGEILVKENRPIHYFEMIRMLVFYSKSRGFDISKIFAEFCENLQNSR